MRRCKKCGQDAAIDLPRYGLNLCGSHFLEFLRTRVKKIIQKYKLINPHERVAVALSGGKDSTVLFHLLDLIYSEALDLVGIHVNLGIRPSGYSADSVRLSRELCEKLGREFHSINLKKEYQITMDLVKASGRRLRRSLCGVCGTFKRYLLNRYSLKLNCEKLATGHILDDEVSVLLMNFFNGNIAQLIRTGPFLPGKKDAMITRIKPLYEISEKETTAYADLMTLDIQEIECPYSTGASTFKYKTFYQTFEKQSPGIGNTILQHYHKKILKPLQMFYKQSQFILNSCVKCKGPTSVKICAFCKIRELVLKDA